MGGARFQTRAIRFLCSVSRELVETFIDGAKAWGETDYTASSYLKCLRFLLPDKLIANTLVNSCADRLFRDGFGFQTGSHNNSVGAEGVG